MRACQEPPGAVGVVWCWGRPALVSIVKSGTPLSFSHREAVSLHAELLRLREEVMRVV